MPLTHKPGTFVRIPLADGSFGYGRILQPPFYAFYQCRTLTPESDLDRIAASPVLFRVSVTYRRRSSWKIIGWREVEEHLNQPIVRFWQDVGDWKHCKVFDTLGNERAASPEECVGLERWAVWDEHSVEERLLDAFMGRPNESVEHMKVRLR